MLGRLMVIIVLLTVPQVHAGLIVNEIGSLGVEPSAIAALDSDSDGVPDTAVVGTSSKAMAFGASSWTVSVMNVFGVAPADFDKNGYMNGAIIAGKDIVAVDHTGQELWKVEKLLGKSAVAFDRDGDGYKDEVVVGCWDRVAAFDSDGELLWNYTEISERNVMNIVLTENSIIASAGKMLYFFSFSGNLRAAKAQSDNIAAISPIDLEGDGTMNGVVVITRDGDYAEINAYTMYGENQGWSTPLRHEEESTIDISASPIDRYSTGKKENVVINLDIGAYWINSGGVSAKIGGVRSPGAVAPIDFDGDGILDDIIISKEGTTKAVYAYSAYGQELAIYNQTGGVKIAAVDLTFDGKANDAIIATSFDKRVYSVISDVSDSTTSSGTTTTTTVPTTTTTLSPQDSTTTTLASADADGILVDLGPDQSVAEGAEVTLTASATPSTSGGIIVSYIWTEDSTVLGLEPSLNKIFSAGEHDVKVEITDNTGAKANDTVRITVTAAGTGSASAADSDSDGWTNEFELRMGTDPDKPDTDEDGIIDSKDPNPLVANDKGSLSGPGRYLSPLLGVVKWIVIVGVIIIVIIYMREKILDMLWDMRKDGSE